MSGACFECDSMHWSFKIFLEPRSKGMVRDSPLYVMNVVNIETALGYGRAE